MLDAKKVLIIGSCVAHDFVRYLFKDQNIHISYIWRVSTPSLLSQYEINSPFLYDPSILQESEKKTIDGDVRKEFLASLDFSAVHYDYIFVDFLRDTYNLLVSPEGQVVTYGVEIEKYNFYDNNKDWRMVQYDSTEFRERWINSIRMLNELLLSSARDRKSVV